MGEGYVLLSEKDAQRSISVAGGFRRLERERRRPLQRPVWGLHAMNRPSWNCLAVGVATGVACSFWIILLVLENRMTRE